MFKYVRILPGNQGYGIRILSKQSNQAAEFIRGAMSVGSLAKKSGKERLTMDNAQKKGVCWRRERRRRRQQMK